MFGPKISQPASRPLAFISQPFYFNALNLTGPALAGSTLSSRELAIHPDSVTQPFAVSTVIVAQDQPCFSLFTHTVSPVAKYG